MLASILSLALLYCFSMPTAADEEWKKTLGEGFYLPKVNIGSPSVTDGTSIFKSLPDTCFNKTKKDTEITDSRSVFESTKSFYEYVSSESGLSGSYIGKFTFGTTLKETSENKFNGTEEVTGTSINIMTHISTAYIKKDC